MAIPAVINTPSTIVPITMGHLYSWGLNDTYQVGDGTTTTAMTPVMVPSFIIRKATKAKYGNAAISHDRKLWVWGSNSFGTLGFGDTVPRTIPIVLSGSLDWADVDVGSRFIAAVKQNGDLYAGGNSSHGQVGNGYIGSTPQAFGLIGNSYSSVACGTDPYDFDGLIAIKTDGSVWYAGSNDFGQGNGVPSTPLNISTPTLSASNSYGFVQVEAEGIYCLALDGAGHVWGRGYNANGELGIGNYTHPITAWTQQAGGDVFTKIITGYRYSLALKSDGSVWGWGGNLTSIFGVSGGGSYSSPTLVQSGPYIDISTTRFNVSYATGFGLKANGIVEAWGVNNNYQFASASPASSTSPVVVDTGYYALARGAYEQGGCGLKP